MQAHAITQRTQGLVLHSVQPFFSSTQMKFLDDFYEDSKRRPKAEQKPLRHSKLQELCDDRQDKINYGQDSFFNWWRPIWNISHSDRRCWMYFEREDYDRKDNLSFSPRHHWLDSEKHDPQSLQMERQTTNFSWFRLDERCHLLKDSIRNTALVSKLQSTFAYIFSHSLNALVDNGPTTSTTPQYNRRRKPFVNRNEKFWKDWWVRTKQKAEPHEQNLSCSRKNATEKKKVMMKFTRGNFHSRTRVWGWKISRTDFRLTNFGRRR